MNITIIPVSEHQAIITDAAGEEIAAFAYHAGYGRMMYAGCSNDEGRELKEIPINDVVSYACSAKMVISISRQNDFQF